MVFQKFETSKEFLLHTHIHANNQNEMGCFKNDVFLVSPKMRDPHYTCPPWLLDDPFRGIIPLHGHSLEVLREIWQIKIYIFPILVRLVHLHPLHPPYRSIRRRRRRSAHYLLVDGVHPPRHQKRSSFRLIQQSMRVHRRQQAYLYSNYCESLRKSVYFHGMTASWSMRRLRCLKRKKPSPRP